MEYYRRRKEALEVFYRNMDKIVEDYSQKKCWVVFGSSRIAGMMISYLKVKGIEVSYIIDNNKVNQGETAYGVPVYKPEDLLIPKREDALVLIASQHQNSMLSQLEGMGYVYGKDILKAIDLPELMSDFSSEDRSGLTPMTWEEIKRTQLEILEFLNKICKENGLRYFASGGGLIGAVRHKGYIPWDDDIDIMMDLRDIKKLSEILKNSKRYKMVSIFDEEFDYFDECSMVVDTETLMDTNLFPTQSTTGVHVDIFVLAGVPDGRAGKDYLWETRMLEAKCYSSMNSHEECRKNIEKLVECYLRYEIKDSPKAGVVTGPYFYRGICDSSVFDEYVELPFEDITIMAPAGYDKYLTNVFGDYMTPPPKEQQVGHHYFKAYWRNK